MPRDGRDARVGTTACGNSVDALTGLGVEDLDAVAAMVRLVAGAADKAAIKTPAHAADGAAVGARHGAAADPVRRVPEGDQGIAAADGEVPACRGEGDGQTGGRVGVQGMQNVEGRVGEDLDGAFSGRGEEVQVG